MDNQPTSPPRTWTIKISRRRTKQDPNSYRYRATIASDYPDGEDLCQDWIGTKTLDPDELAHAVGLLTSTFHPLSQRMVRAAKSILERERGPDFPYLSYDVPGFRSRDGRPGVMLCRHPRLRHEWVQVNRLPPETLRCWLTVCGLTILYRWDRTYRFPTITLLEVPES